MSNKPPSFLYIYMINPFLNTIISANREILIFSLEYRSEKSMCQPFQRLFCVKNQATYLIKVHPWLDMDNLK